MRAQSPHANDPRATGRTREERCGMYECDSRAVASGIRRAPLQLVTRHMEAQRGWWWVTRAERRGLQPPQPRRDVRYRRYQFWDPKVRRFWNKVRSFLIASGTQLWLLSQSGDRDMQSWTRGIRCDFLIRGARFRVPTEVVDPVARRREVQRMHESLVPG